MSAQELIHARRLLKQGPKKEAYYVDDYNYGNQLQPD